MVIKQGKVKSISANKITIRAQLILWFIKPWLIGIIDNKLNWISRHESGGSITIPTKDREIKGEFKTLVVETIEKCTNCYYGEIDEDDPKPCPICGGNEVIIHQFPLKYKQWQLAIDNCEVDSNIIVDYEIIMSWKDNDVKTEPINYAKIIPQTKKSYTEEENLERLADLLTKYNVRHYLNINAFGYSPIEREIVELFTK